MSSFKSWIASPLSSKKLEKTGQMFYMLGKLLLVCGLIGLGLLLFSIIITAMIDSDWVGLLLTFNISNKYWIMYIIMFLAYLLIGFGSIGFLVYFFGLFVFGIGRIANNTEKKSVVNNNGSISSASKDWVCLCGEVNPGYASRCYCGKTEKEVREARKAINTPSSSSAPQNNKNNDTDVEVFTDKLICPECKSGLDFMGWDENDLNQTQNCPICNAKISIKK